MSSFDISQEYSLLGIFLPSLIIDYYIIDLACHCYNITRIAIDPATSYESLIYILNQTYLETLVVS